MDWIYLTTKTNKITKISKFVLHTPLKIHDWLNIIYQCEKNINIKFISFHDYDLYTYKVNPKEVMEDISILTSNLPYFYEKYKLSNKISASEIEMSYLTQDNNSSYFQDWLSTEDSDGFCELNEKRLLEFFEALKLLVQEAIENDQELWFDED